MYPSLPSEGKARVRVRSLSPVRALAAVAVAASLGACASTGPGEGFAATDSYEPTSRAIHAGNVGLDSYVLRPVANGYRTVTPALFQHLIGNGLGFLELPGDIVNYALQGDVDASLRMLGRLTLNAFLGAGVLDPATEFGLPAEPTDFGITLGTHGVGEGSYIVLPLLGPSTVRDTAGFVVDRAFSPTSYIGAFTGADALGPTATGLGIVDGRARNGDVIDEILYESDDSYVTLRAAYLQRRRAQIAGDAGVIDNLPDIFDDEAPKE